MVHASSALKKCQIQPGLQEEIPSQEAQNKQTNKQMKEQEEEGGETPGYSSLACCPGLSVAMAIPSAEAAYSGI